MSSISRVSNWARRFNEFQNVARPWRSPVPRNLAGGTSDLRFAYTPIMKLYFVMALASTALLAQNSPQTPGAKLEFEVASIRAAAPLLPQQVVNVGLHLDGSQARIVAFTLKDFIAMAYRVKAYQISGPDSISDRFDLNAKLPADRKSTRLN